MACCEYGKMTLTVNGQIVSARGEFTLRPTNFEREGGANEDGSIWSSYKPVPAEAEGSVDACTTDISTLWDLCDVTVTFELNSGESYVYPRARIMGRPELNTSNGETSGFKIMSAQARRVK